MRYTYIYNNFNIIILIPLLVKEWLMMTSKAFLLFFKNVHPSPVKTLTLGLSREEGKSGKHSR